MANYEQVEVPDIGDFSDVPVIEILVSVGDSVVVDSPLLTLESDKAAMDVPSPVAGTVYQVLVDPGDKVSQGTPVMVIEPDILVDAAGGGNGSLAEEVARIAAELDVEGPATAAAGRRQPEQETETATSSAPAPAESPTGGGEPGPRPGTATVAMQTVPDIGDFSDVEIIEVHVTPGDAVTAEDPLITLESDKAAMDVPATATGRVAEVFVEVGDRVSTGTPIASLAGIAADTGLAEPSLAAPVEDIKPPAPPPTLPMPVEKSARAKPHASPSVRLFARELGVDLVKVQGTGPSDRILKADVQAYVKQALSETVAASAATAAQVTAIPQVPIVEFGKFGEVETRPLPRIKKLSGAHLHRCWLNVPQVTHHDEADITDVEAFRRTLQTETERRGVRLTLLAFVMKAVAATLRDFPQFNASLGPGGDTLIYKKYCHIGIAVDTPDGLVVPVLRDVDHKGVYELAAEMSEISARARDGKLRPEDMQGGCISISSLGGIAGTAFTPIVNAPEVAILGLTRSRMTPVWNDDEFVPRLLLPLDLSYDHRIIDGAEAARFLSMLSVLLGDTRRLLL